MELLHFNIPSTSNVNYGILFWSSIIHCFFKISRFNMQDYAHGC